MRWMLATIFAGLLSGAAHAESDQARYEIRPGTLSGLPSTAANPTPPVTILIDHQTGRTWFLAVIDGEVRWQALRFGKAASADTLPPVPRSEATDDDLRGSGDGIYKR